MMLSRFYLSILTIRYVQVQIEEYYCYLASPQNSDSLCSLILQMEKIDSEAIQYYSKMELVILHFIMPLANLLPIQPVDKTSTHLKGARKHSHIKHFISDKGFLSSISSFNQHRSPLKNLPQTKNTNKKLSKSSAMEESVKGKHWRNVQAHARSAENLLTRRTYRLYSSLIQINRNLIAYNSP